MFIRGLFLNAMLICSACTSAGSIINFGPGPFSTAESAGEITLPVLISDETPRAITASATWAITAGDVSLSDLGISSGTLYFLPDHTQTVLRIPIIDDTIPEPAENMTITLLDAQGAETGSQNTWHVQIESNDGFGSPADLTGVWSRSGGDCSRRSCLFSGNVIVTNNGGTAADVSQMAVYRSRNAVLDSRDKLVTTYEVPSVNFSDPVPVFVGFNVARRSRARFYYFAVLNSSGTIQETNLDNNIVSLGKFQ